MHRDWFCASVLALSLAATPSPAVAQEDILNCAIRAANCATMLAAIEYTIAEDALLHTLRSMADRRLAELGTSLDPAAATALQQDEAVFRKSLNRDLSFFADDLPRDSESRYYLAQRLAWRLDALDRLDPDPPAFDGLWVSANGRVSLVVTSESFAITADSVELNRLVWTCEFHGDGRLKEGVITAIDSVDRIELRREGAALRLVHTPPDGQAAWHCGAGGSLSGLYFHLD
jgi:hypothetical protein